jgi:hypothetical protein
LKWNFKIIPNPEKSKISKTQFQKSTSPSNSATKPQKIRPFDTIKTHLAIISVLAA